MSSILPPSLSHQLLLNRILSTLDSMTQRADVTLENTHMRATLLILLSSARYRRRLCRAEKPACYYRVSGAQPYCQTESSLQGEIRHAHPQRHTTLLLALEVQPHGHRLSVQNSEILVSIRIMFGIASPTLRRAWHRLQVILFTDLFITLHRRRGDFSQNQVSDYARY